MAFNTQTASFPDERSCLQRAGRRDTASLQTGNIPERVSIIIQRIGQPDIAADRYSPSLPPRGATTMTVLTTPNCPKGWDIRTDRSIRNTFRLSYSVPLPSRTAIQRLSQRDCVGSQLVSTLPVCYDEDTKHAPGRVTLTVSRVL